MLVLSRKVGEVVIIGQGIRVQVVAVRGNTVRLGFVAPDDVAIVRQEIHFDASESVHEESNAYQAPLAAR